MLRIPPRHNGVMSIKVSGPVIEEHMAYLITVDNTSKTKDPNINIISGIHKIKGKTSVNILVSNYTNKHLTFHKGDYVRHLEPAVMDDNTIDQTETHQTYSITWKMMAEIVTPDTFNPPCLDMTCSKLSKMNLMSYYRNMSPNLHKMKLQLELLLSPTWQ